MSIAKKWDELQEKIASYYGYENPEGEWVEHEGNDHGDLLDIGEAAARAFGFM